MEESKIFSIFLLRKKPQICKKIKKYLYLSILYVLQNIMTIDTVSEHEYKQNNVKENFAEREVSDLINKTRNELNKLESSVVMFNWKEIDGWSKELVNKAVRSIDKMYRIEWDKVVFNMREVSSFLNSIYTRLSNDICWNYDKHSSEAIFPWTVFAVQVALESLRRTTAPADWKYDVWIINGQLNTSTMSAIKEFQYSNNVTPNGNPTKETIWALLKALKTQPYNYEHSLKDGFTALWKLSVLPDVLFDEKKVVSAPYEHSKTSTLCSKTARLNAAKFWIKFPFWNAFIASTKQPVDKQHYVDSIPKNKESIKPRNDWKRLTEADFDNKSANVADIYVTSRSQYWHRATAFRGNDWNWNVLDPYRVGWHSRKAVPLSEYMWIVGRNWGGIVKAHFYLKWKNES